MSEDSQTRVRPVHCRGRWRAVKRKLLALAAELGWPECMEVAHADQIEGCVLRAGAKLSRWHKLSKHRRKPAARSGPPFGRAPRTRCAGAHEHFGTWSKLARQRVLSLARASLAGGTAAL